MNQSINVLQFDPDIKLGKEVNTNEILLKVVNLLEKEDQEYIDNIPISKRPPFIYTTEDENSIHQFILEALGLVISIRISRIYTYYFFYKIRSECTTEQSKGTTFT